MRDAAKLRLRIFEVSHCSSRVRRETSHVVVRRVAWCFVAREDRFPFIVERRDYRLVRFRVAPKHSRRFKRLQVHTIDTWTIAFRRRAQTRQVNVIAALHDRTGAPAPAETATATT